jgi:hypothetical protein
MMIEKLRITVLAEDKRHQSFVLRYLRILGCSPHRIRREPLPKGTGGAGELWVRERYAESVYELRRRSENVALIVVIDADTHEVSKRRVQLEEQLRSPRGPHERIVYFIPKRNIETWILCLDGEMVNEVEDYSKIQGIGERIRPAADTFHSWTRPNAVPPNRCIPSLSAAIPEAQRLER